MDAHGLPLVTSVVLGKRSRVQDFWIFSAPAPPKSASTSSSPASPEHPIRKPAQDASQPPEHMYSGSHSMLDRNASRKKDGPSSLAAQSPSGHVRSASNPQNPPQSHRASHIRNATIGSTPHVLRKASPRPTTPTRAADLSVIPSAVPEKLASREKSIPSPAKVSSSSAAQSVKPAQLGLPSEFPPYPPNSHPVRLYPLDHVPGASPEVLYSTSRPQEPVYRQVPSGTFQITPPPPMSPRDLPPPVVPIDVPARPAGPEQQSSWSDHGDFLPDDPHDLDDLLPPEAFRNISTTSTDVNPDESFRTASEMFEHFTWAERVGQKDAPQIPIAEDDGDGAARSPKLVQPNLDDPDDPRLRRSEKVLHDIVLAKAGSSPVDNSTGKDIEKETEDERRSQRATTMAAAAEIVAKSGYRPTVDIPMTVRDSDVVSSGPWVLIHTPGTSPTSKDIPVPSPTSDPSGAPLKVIPVARPPPIKPIPSDGDQTAYESPAKVKKSVFPWSKNRREQKEKEQHKVQANGKEREPDKPKSVKGLDPSSAEGGKHSDGPSKNPSSSSGSLNSSIPQPTTPNTNEPPAPDSTGHLIKGVTNKFKRKGVVEVQGDKRMSID